MSWWNDFLNSWGKDPGYGTNYSWQDLWKEIQKEYKGAQGALAPAPGAGSAPGTAGAPVDPTQALLAQIGAALGGSSASGGSSGSASAPAGYTTPDGVWINDNSPQDTYYRMIDAVWTRLYGAHPPFSMVQTMRDLGVENTSQLDTIMLQMPSHIKNPDGSAVPLGVYDQIKGVGNSFSDKYFGRPIPDSLITEWVKKGITDPESIELWFLNHPAHDIPKDVYGKLFDQAAGLIKKTWSDLPHPDTIHAAYQVAQAMTSGAASAPAQKAAPVPAPIAAKAPDQPAAPHIGPDASMWPSKSGGLGGRSRLS